MSFLAPLILALYLTAFIYENAFFVQKLLVVDKGNQLFFNNLGIFVIILVPAFFLMKKVMIHHSSKGARGMFKTALLSVAILGLIMSFLYHTVPISSVYDFPAQIDQFFASDTYFTLWLLIPLAVLFI